MAKMKLINSYYPEDMLNEVRDWAESKDPPVKLSEALRWFLRKGLDAEKENSK